MALENGFFPQDPFYYAGKEFYSWGCDYSLQQPEEDKGFSFISNKNIQFGNLHQSCLMIQDVNNELWADHNDSSPDAANCSGSNGQIVTGDLSTDEPPVTTTDRKRRRRPKSCKNKEDMETQRMTHIAVERNRRKQMNEYLAVIRSLMPTSYVQRGDQASIIGGAINFVKELEKQLQTLEAQNKKTIQEHSKNCSTINASSLFSDFFTFPQYSTCNSSTSSENDHPVEAAERRAAVVAYGDIEVTVMESHANLKILTKKRPKQLIKIVAGVQNMWLTILHVNVTTVDQMVLYTITVKIEEGCQLNTSNEIADAVNYLLEKIEEAE